MILPLLNRHLSVSSSFFLIAAVTLVFGSFGASAQVYSRTQSFDAAYIPPVPVTGSELGFSSSKDGSYFSSAVPTVATRFGTFGVQNNGNAPSGTSATLTFNSQVFQAGSSNNIITFLIGSLQNGSGGNAYTDGFGNSSSIDVALTRSSISLPPTTFTILTLTPASNSNGAVYLPGAAGTDPDPDFTTNGTTNKTVHVSLANGLSKVTIRLPDFFIRTVVGFSITINTSKRNILVVDNVTISSGKPLPVELTRFDATAKGQSVNVSWATASEKNNDHFDVQRSATGSSYKTIGSVQGQGNSTTAHDYAFLDSYPLAGLSYYRLRQVDADGSSNYSPVATVQSAAGQKAIAFPNPSTGTITLPALDGPIHYRIYNNIGQTLLSGQAIGNEQFDITKIPRGTFFLELTSQSGRTTQRLMRE